MTATIRLPPSASATFSPGFIAAALIAALLSTVDSLINATTAIFIFDVYKPLHKKDQPDAYYLKSARWTTLIVTVLAVSLVPVFHSFGTIYKAHGWFHSTVIPPLVVAVFMGILWPRFTSKAAVWTFIGGGIMIVLGQIFPQLVKPFAHGTPAVQNQPYIFIGALYNIICCSAIGFVVTLFTKPKAKKDIDGLTLWSIKGAKRIYKDGEPNELPGMKPTVSWKIADLTGDLVSLSEQDMKKMQAFPGDLVYLCDKRRYLGGLKSIHGRLGQPHQEEGIVYLSQEMVLRGIFTPGKPLYAEKEL